MPTRRSPIWFLTLAVVVASHVPWLSAALAQPVPVGPEFQVNTDTTGFHFAPSVAVDPSGNFLVVWPGTGSAGGGIQGQRYDTSGTPIGGQFQINSYTPGAPSGPAVAADAVGNFIVVWESIGSPGSDTSGRSILTRRFDGNGVAQGPELQVNTYTTSDQEQPRVASTSTGEFIVVWQSIGSPGSDTQARSIQGRLFDAAGAARGDQFQVNSGPGGNEYRPSVGIDGLGNIVVAWDTNYDVMARRFDSRGTPQDDEFAVGTYFDGHQTNAAVAVDAGGTFVVAWHGLNASHPYTGVQVRRFDADGTPLTGEVVLSSRLGLSASVAPAGDGQFVVAWSSYDVGGSDTDLYHVRGQLLDSTAAPQGPPFQVNTYTTGYQRTPAVAANPAGDVVVVWGSSHNSPPVATVRGQRYSIDASNSTSTTSTSSTSTSSTSTTSSTLSTTYLLPGRVTIVKPGTLAKFVSKPPTGSTFTLPPAASVAAGGSLRIFDTAATAGDDTFTLPATGWLSLGPAGANGYKYRGAGTIGDPCRVVLIRTKTIKGVCKGTGVTLTPPFAGDVGITLSVGTSSVYCARFGGTEARNDATSTTRKNAPAPGACP